jgi:hypothetical protein
MVTPVGIEMRESEEAVGDGRPAGGEPGGARRLESPGHGYRRRHLGFPHYADG